MVGRSSQDKGDCSIPFLTESALTFGMAIDAFELPVTMMGILYWKTYWEIEKEAQDLEGLLGSRSSGGASHGSEGRTVYSSSTMSSASRSRKVSAGREQSSEGSQGCFPVRGA